MRSILLLKHSGETMIHRIVSLLIILLLLIQMTFTTYTHPYQGIVDEKYLEKFHPSLRDKIKWMNDDEVLTLIVRLRNPPPPAQNIGTKSMIDYLKVWTKYIQTPIVSAIVEEGGIVLNRFWIDNLLVVRGELRVFKKIAKMSPVIEIFENFKVNIESYQASPIFQQYNSTIINWGVEKINAPHVWEEGVTGRGVRIAVLDTGIDPSHPLLKGKLFTLNPDSPYYPGGWIEFDEYGNPVLSTPHDTGYHGTHVGGIIAGGDPNGTVTGVAPGARLMYALVTPGGTGSFAQVVAGIQWAVDPYYIDPSTGDIVYTGLPANIIDMSIGVENDYGNEFIPAIKTALEIGVIVVASIGNNGPGTTSNPGNIWGVYGIGATDQNDTIASFSGGRLVYWPDQPGDWPFNDTYPSTYIKPDFSAPGVDIISTAPGGGYTSISGTSMAAPHVAGTIALLLEATGWSSQPINDLPETIYDILRLSSIDLGDPGMDTRYGWGRIDAYQAYLIAKTLTSTTGIRGLVRDGVDHEPVRWAVVRIIETNQSCMVNSNGSFELPLEPGTYHLEITAWGYIGQIIEVGVTVINSTLIGKVYNLLTGEPVPNATVRMNGLGITCYTDENGMFNISLKPGTYNISISREGFAPVWRWVTICENTTTLIEIPLIPSGTGKVVGYVVDEDTGEPIVNATITVNGTSISNTTDVNGYYELTLYTGGYNLVVWAPYYNTTIENVYVYEGQTTWLNITLHHLPPQVIVLGNTLYETRPHIADIVRELGYPVVEISDVSILLSQWNKGLIYPRIIIIDHFTNQSYMLPSITDVLELLGKADQHNVSLIFLGTAYAGYTSIDVLYEYSDEISHYGYPSIASINRNFTDPYTVIVVPLAPSNPIFQNITLVNNTWFYLADPYNSSHVDYTTVTFIPNMEVEPLALINDTTYGTSGIGIACWASPSGAKWFYLSSWGESFWMQYDEPGIDGMYSNETRTVLQNIIRMIYNSYPETYTSPVIHISLEEKEYGSRVIPQSYTFLDIKLERKPYGNLRAVFIGSKGEVPENITVIVLGTPISLSLPNNTLETWLPEGNYTILVMAPGYLDKYINITIEANKTTNLGRIELRRIPRIAILYDYNDELRKLITNNLMWYAVDYSNITELVSEAISGFYDVIIYAGYQDASFPSEEEFSLLVSTSIEHSIGMIFLNQWSPSAEDYGYGINMMSKYLGEPSNITNGITGGEPLRLYVYKNHPVLRGYSPGDIVELMYDPGINASYYSYFHGFNGTIIGKILVNNTIKGDLIAVKEYPQGPRWLLLGSFAPFEYENTSSWSLDAVRIFLNGVVWVGLKPLNITLDKHVYHVGDTAVLEISNAPPRTVFNISIDGILIGNVSTDYLGEAIYVFQIPLLPRGRHLLEARSIDGVYYSSTYFYITPSIIVNPRVFNTPAMINIVLLGYSPGAVVSVYIDGNYLARIKTNSSGAASTYVNIPDIVSGIHHLYIYNSTNDELIADIILNTTSKTSILETRVSMIEQEIIEINGWLVNITGDIAEIRTQYGLLRIEISKLNMTLLGIIESRTGEIYYVLNTTKGVLLARIDVLQDRLDEIRGINETLNQLINLITSHVIDYKSIRENFTSIHDQICRLDQEIKYISGNISDARKRSAETWGSILISTAIGVVALILSLGLLVYIYLSRKTGG